MRRAGAAAWCALLAAGLFVTQRADRPPHSLVVAWLERHAPGERVVGPPTAHPDANPVRQQAEELIAEPGRPQYSLLWLEALGATHLITADQKKFGELLETEFEDRTGRRVYKTPVHSAAAAVLVSRYEWKNRPAFRSLYDRRALDAYIAWADRPESAGFRRTGAQTAEVRADLGPDDMILVRQSTLSGWSASIDGAPIAARRDPVGFLLLDPGRSGWVTIRLRASGGSTPRGAAERLSTEVFPAINAGGVGDARRGTPPPFPPGAYITIYGTELTGEGATRVLVAGRDAAVLYAAELQINARLPPDLPPGRAELVVEVGTARSESVEIEIGARR